MVNAQEWVEKKFPLVIKEESDSEEEITESTLSLWRADPFYMLEDLMAESHWRAIKEKFRSRPRKEVKKIKNYHFDPVDLEEINFAECYNDHPEIQELRKKCKQKAKPEEEKGKDNSNSPPEVESPNEEDEEEEYESFKFEEESLFSEEELEEEILATKRKIRYEEIKARNEHLLRGALDLTEFQSLQKLQLTNQELASINVRELVNLKVIMCSGNHLTNLHANDCSYLEKLDCSVNRLTSLDFTSRYNSQYHHKEYDSLTELDCSDNQLTSLDLSDFPKLIVLRCSRNQLTNLDLRKNTKLEIVDVSQNKISANLDIFTQLKNLKELFLGSSSVTLGETENDFTGHLDSLKVNRELKIVAISQQRNIKGNLVSLLYLMSEKLEYFYCQGTEYQNLLEPQEYKVKEWKSTNIVRLEEERTQLATESDNRITELENELEIEQEHAKNVDYHYRERILKPVIEEKEQICKERDQLKKLTEKLAKELSYKEEEIRYYKEQLIKTEKGEVVVHQETATQTIITRVAEEISDLYSQLELLKLLSPEENKEEKAPTDETEQLLPSRDIIYSAEEERITTALSEKRQELINLSEQAMTKEKEIRELRRQLAKTEQARINKQYEEKLELVALILQDLKNR